MTPELATILWVVAVTLIAAWLIHDPKGGAGATKG